MLFRGIHGSSLLPLAGAAAFLILASTACRRDAHPVADADPGLSGEPESYSATVVRAIDDGAERELSVTRIARSGEMRREEWNERAGRRALIWRPDQGKAFLLDLDKRIYVELPLSFSSGREAEPREERGAATTSDDAPRAVEPESFETLLDDAPSPVSVETRLLADQTIDGHLCKVYERRAVFAGGNAEVTTTFRAPGLGGLAIRTEIAAAPQGSSGKVIISRRDVKLVVAPGEFIVPPEFKKVDKLSLPF